MFTNFCHDLQFNAEHLIRTLYENYLAEDKWKYIITLDEAWVYLNDREKKDLFFIKSKVKKMCKFRTISAKKVSERDL